MELTITSDFAKHLFTRSKKDVTLARELARQFLNSVEPRAMAQFLLQPKIAEELLATRVMQDPEGTLKELQVLEGGRVPADRPKRPGRPRGSKKRAATKPGRRSGSHARLTRGQSETLKKQVKSFLAQHPWSTRKELTAVVKLPTQAIYRRIMGELLAAGEVVSQGEKSKTVYALQGRGRKPAKKQAAPKKAVPKQAAPKKAPKKAAKKQAAPKKAPKKAAKKQAAPKTPAPAAFGPSLQAG